MKLLNHKTASDEEKATAVDIGRPNPLQNPFPMQSGYSREECVKLFKDYFISKLLTGDKVITDAFLNLRKNDSLICYCAPKACHGDVIIEVFELFDSFWNPEEGFKAIREKYQSSLSPNESPNDKAIPIELINTLLLEEQRAYLKPEPERLKAYEDYVLKQLASRDAKFENAFRYIVSMVSTRETIDRFLGMSGIISKKAAVLQNLFQEWRNYSGHSDFIEAIRGRSSVLGFNFKPETEGIDHINLYSKSKTELGRLGSNFAFTPFEHPRYGKFNSVEGFWYWLSTGMEHEGLRWVHGYEAKQLGLSIRKTIKEGKGNQSKPLLMSGYKFKQEIKKAILCKIEQNEHLRELLRTSTLPLTHYYVYGQDGKQIINYPETFAWIHEYISDVRDYLNGKAYKLLIAGSRDIIDFGLVEGFYHESGFKAIEFISGAARGIDSVCIDLAKKLETPCEIFEADSDGLGKSAGHIRNAAMGDYCTAAILVWDGKSPGTKNMLDKLQRDGTKHLLFTNF